MESIKKRIFNKIKSLGWVQWIMAGFIWLVIKIIYWLNRKEIVGSEKFTEFRNKPAIFVFWHGRSLVMPCFANTYRIRGYVTSSLHPDGLMMAKAQRLFGMKSIFGSNAKGALNVLRGGVRVLEEGNRMILTVDGPKGPRMRVNNGCIFMAKVTSAPIIPVCLTATRSKILRSWDRLMLVKPFGKIIGVVGDPIYYDHNNPNEMDDLRVHLENLMVKQLHDLDAKIGLPPIEQGDVRK